jgi:hypothetical protein
MRPTIPRLLGATAVLGLVFAAGQAYSELPTKGGLTILQPRTPPPPSGPSTTINLRSLALGGQIATTPPVNVSVLGSNIGLGGYVTLTRGSSLTANITGDTTTTAPAGRYRVRFNFINVAGPSTINLTTQTGASIGTCSLAQKPGYNELQVCDAFFTGTGAPFVVNANVDQPLATQGRQITISSVQVYKES